MAKSHDALPILTDRGLARPQRQHNRTIARQQSRPDLRSVISQLLVLVIALGISLATTASFAQQQPRQVPSQANTNELEINAPQNGAPLNGAIQEGMPPVANDQAAALPGAFDVEQMLSPGGLTSTLKIMLLLTVLSLAPSILIMTTCFIRFIIVLGLLRQALGTQQLPPNQVIISLCMFLTFMVMAPVWSEAYEQGVVPYTQPDPAQPPPSLQVAFENTLRPLRRFMSEQIDKSDNGDAVLMFLDFQHPDSENDENYPPPSNYEDVPLSALLPAFMMSELKVAFVIGFQVYLPFLVIDMVVSSILISMGMMMLPPVLISLPFKLLLFVMIDGWFITVGMLLESVRPFG